MVTEVKIVSLAHLFPINSLNRSACKKQDVSHREVKTMNYHALNILHLVYNHMLKNVAMPRKLDN